MLNYEFMTKFCAGFVIALGLWVLPSLSAATDILRWVDEKGIVHFTDNVHNIPEKYRGNATRIKAVEPPRQAEPAKPEPAKASVSLQQRGQVAIVQATLNGKAPASLIVDTGASYTMISRAIAKELEIEIDGKNLPTIPFQTANGVISAPVVKLESIEIGGMQIRDLTAAVYDTFPDASVSGLLGLNFLSHFRMDIDSKNGLLHLEKK
jgi:clan AA aspartic protease (TIGR02281 family)